MKKVLKSCLNPNQFKVLEKAEKTAIRFHFIFCKADEEHVKITIMKIMKLCSFLKEECLKNQSSVILDENLIHTILNYDLTLKLLNCLKMILHNDTDLNNNTNSNRNMERTLQNSTLIKSSMEITIIQEVIPANTSNPNISINKLTVKSSENEKTTNQIIETTTHMPENETSSTFSIVVSSVITTSLLGYGAYKMKARLSRLLK